MKDYRFTFRKNGAPVTLDLLYLDSLKGWEVYFEVPTEYQVEHKSQALEPYDTFDLECDHVYHNENWSIDLGEVWDWVYNNEANISWTGKGPEVYQYAQSEYEFYKESDNGYFAMFEWVTFWFDNVFVITK